MNLHLDHVGVVAADVDASVRFYCTLLDAEAMSRAGHMVVATDELQLAIVPRRPGDSPSVGYGRHLAFRLPASERPTLEARLAALGAPWELVRGCLYALDPDGMAVEFLFD
ncbi:MAG: VOC family protein [bacterium]